MAQQTLQDTKLKLVFDNGFDGEGKPVIKSKTFGNIRLEATADQLYQAATAIDSLTSQALWKIERIEHSNIGA